MDLGLAGKVALVTGGGRGIGAAIAMGLAREGCDVVIVDHGAMDAAHQVVRDVTALGRNAKAVEADVADYSLAETTVADAHAAMGRLDILVCCAGITRDAVSWKMTEADWDSVLAVNLKGFFTYCHAAARLFKEQRSGRIVNIASINGLRGKFGQANYAAAKAGGIALSKSLAKELGRFGVNVNVVAPGLIETEMTRKLPREAMDAAVAETVLGRPGSPDDVANAVVFLCSERARHITGEVIKVDGGQYI